MRDYVEPYAVNRLCLSMRNVRDYDPPKDYHCVATVLYPIVVPHIAHAQTQTVYGRRLNVNIWGCLNA